MKSPIHILVRRKQEKIVNLTYFVLSIKHYVRTMFCFSNSKDNLITKVIVSNCNFFFTETKSMLNDKYTTILERENIRIYNVFTSSLIEKVNRY